jgi:hypothetical protein
MAVSRVTRLQGGWPAGRHITLLDTPRRTPLKVGYGIGVVAAGDDVTIEFNRQCLRDIINHIGLTLVRQQVVGESHGQADFIKK